VVALLIAHGVLALAALSIALLEAFGRWGWALLATVLGCVVAFGVDRVIDRSFTPGARILVGALVALAAAAGPLVALLREPDRNLAAAL
jgi:O-antigen ligase